jgi:hypothetical protein
MKKVMLTSLLGILIISCADAQDRYRGYADKNPGMHADSQTMKELHEKHMTELINAIDAKASLTDAEKEGLKGIFENFHQSMKTLRGNSDSMKIAIVDRNNSARALLSDPKYIAYLEVMTEMKAMHHKRSPEQMMASRTEHLIEALDGKVGLTEEEKNGIRSVYREYYEQLKADPNNREKAISERNEKLKKLLSEEKYTAFEELMSEMQKKHKKHKARK